MKTKLSGSASNMDIEAIIDDLAYAQKLPKTAVLKSLSAPVEVVSRTVDIINRCIECDDLDDGTVSEAEQNALSILVHIVGELGAPDLFQPLLKLLACDRDKVDLLLGDAVTETIDKILISTYDGATQSLLVLMNNPRADAFCRSAAFSAWTYLAAKEVWPMEVSTSYLTKAFEDLQPEKDSFVWVCWLDAVAILGLKELVPLADKVFAELRFGVDLIFGRQILPIEKDDFARVLQGSLDATDQDKWLRKHGLYPFEDAIAELSRWHCYSEKYHKEQRREQMPFGSFGPTTNEKRNVGRNDPCPSGSGKKFKKCCLV